MTTDTLTTTLQISVARIAGDPLKKFEQFRHYECRYDHWSFRPAQIEVPPQGESAELRLLRYIENAELALNMEGKPTFRSFGWSSRGHIGFTPLQHDAIGTGTYWAGSVVLGIDEYGELELTIHFADNGDDQLAHAQQNYVKEVQRFLEA